MLKKIFSNTVAQLVAKFFGAGLTFLTTLIIIRLWQDSTFTATSPRSLVLVAIGFTAIDFGFNAEGLRSSRDDLSMRQSLAQTSSWPAYFSQSSVVIVLNLIVEVLPGGYSQRLNQSFGSVASPLYFRASTLRAMPGFPVQVILLEPHDLGQLVGSRLAPLLTFYLKHSPLSPIFVLLTNLSAIFSMAISPFSSFSPRIQDSRQCGFTMSPFSLRRSALVLGLILIASVIASKIDTVLCGSFRLSGRGRRVWLCLPYFDVIPRLPVF